MRRTLPFLVAFIGFSLGWLACLTLDGILFADATATTPIDSAVSAPNSRPADSTHFVFKPIAAIATATTTDSSNDGNQPAVDEPTRPIAVNAAVTGDWPQWGGDSARNNVPIGTNIPDDWQVGKLDRKTVYSS